MTWFWWLSSSGKKIWTLCWTDVTKSFSLDLKDCFSFWAWSFLFQTESWELIFAYKEKSHFFFKLYHKVKQMGQTAIIASIYSFIYDRNQASININNLKMELDIAQILTLSVFLFIFSFFLHTIIWQSPRFGCNWTFNSWLLIQK